MGEPLFYSVADAAKILGISKTLLYDQINAGKFPSMCIGRRRLVSRLHLESLAQPSDNSPKGGYNDGKENTKR